MPAHRSEAEKEVRDAVVERLRVLRPNARIIHEINVAGPGSNRVDVLAVDTAEIIACEIKSAKDKLDRLPDQVKAMQGIAYNVIAAVHEKHLVEHKTHISNSSAHFERDGELYINDIGDDWPRRSSAGLIYWIYPRRRRCPRPDSYDDLAKWGEPAQALQRPKIGALEMLWADELRRLCHVLRVACNSRSTRGQMINDLVWFATGAEITKGICAALRARDCMEADPAIPFEMEGDV